MNLLPCPFCEENDIDIISIGRNHWSAECTNCGCTLESARGDRKDMIDEWNKRPNPESAEFLRGFLEAKRQILEIIDKLQENKLPEK